jgi:hypothetical protein
MIQMGKDIQLSIRVSQEEQTAWKAEAEKRNVTISEFIRDCVFRIMGDAQSSQVMDTLNEIKKELDFKSIHAELVDLKRAMLEQSTIVEGKKAELFRIARETSDVEHNSRVLDFLATNGEATLQVITAATGLIEAHVYKALQILTGMGSIEMVAARRPTTWRVKA